MADYRATFDAELRDIHTSFLDHQRGNPQRVYPLHSVALAGGPVSVRLQFSEDLAGIEARGFRTEWVEGGFARGDVELAELAAVASHPGVIQLEYGGGFQPLLDTSATEINARGTGKVWTVNVTTGAFTGFRGASVLIGVIDTGIDIRHPVFLKPGSTNTTRIRRIWDMGIDPHDGIGSPDVSLLQGSVTYGVEYDDKMIDDILQNKPGAKPVKHRDCHGHGTHVAAIAAGDGRAERARKKYQFVGVAPAADLIIVKMLYLQKVPTVSLERRFEDAFTYLERVAKNRLGDRPVVINASIGFNLGPHDGLGGRDQLLETRYRASTKKAFVAAAGNDGGMRQHGVIVIPSGGQIDVPFTLYDERHVRTDRSRCDPRPNAEPEMVIEFWYKPPSGQASLTSSLRPPTGPAITGPALGATISGTYPTNRAFMITHDPDTAARPPGSPVTRNVLRIKFSASKNSYGAGAFTLRLTGPPGLTIHAWTNQFFPFHGIRIGHDKPNSANQPDWMKRLKPLPAGVTVPNTTTMNSPASSAGAIAVANYDDSTGALADDSSQGPLADYSAIGPYAAKPDIAAPGFEITAASGKKSFLSELATKLLGQPGGAYASFSGTSAATPHVVGVAALMFEKKPNLPHADLVTKLEGNTRAATPKEEFGEGKVDAKAARDAT